MSGVRSRSTGGIFVANNIFSLLTFNGKVDCFGLIQEMLCLFHVRILTSFGTGDLGTEVDFLYAMMWVTKVTF